MQTASPGDGRLDAVGLVPAAGRARRLGARCRSKELEPVYRRGGVGDSAPRPVIERLLDAFSEARLCRVIVVTRIAKADVRKALLAHAGAGTDSPSRPPRPPTIEHVVLEDSPSAAFTVAAGTRLAGDRPIALGFPDVLWEGRGAFSRLLARLDRDDADLVLGLFPPAPGYPTERVDVSRAGDEVRGFPSPDRAAPGDPTWTLAVWRPLLSRFLEEMVEARYGGEGSAPEPGGGRATPEPGELTMTQVFAAALDRGFAIRGVEISRTPFLDIGDPERLEAALRRASVRRPPRPG